ncbi:UbiX family flavin prenyltransferase [Bradyrhizobium diazoefficiens]|uniref:Flavin prenyltransferase UbiX n=1 Tax=Bradyrhizobium diazoefficiens SEMIA 5080 TaxID=754504 RepID=A0A837C470_9BRAD|nr:UbiX family flavin prenyltransferase [Bradyrhizobium diazoefficiens]APO56605.1 3-octaprenyl-4-hydroxybenzoate carboxy-lyase [Bradyrhizobium diazoefficiens]KGJ64009.1 3-octaprenyl-4-hydroxybenzoate carboxy-lyase [Bradyrhizobium diazoefficiens SEMIA 5080]KOY06707.1 3-octaprenyl-4-hydroxybenzoate carboxy-lyase [Bradyrhizobium diazoefficiens]MCD9294221.1 UbiX family flavin prenyltransferase [Bradyrhizobium diazoefficiens]MCD9812044.1 UbiX family flavin prenyltransferase [Bradyrhizobium diazoeff
MSERHGVIVGISGASGAAIGVRIVERLAENPHCAVHLVISPAAERTLAEEVGPEALPRLRALAFRDHAASDIGASIASGSFPVGGMIVAPCSIRTLSAVAFGQLDNLLVRAADVQLKERRRLVLLVRESPLHLGHLRAMVQATEIGAIIAPPLPAFYLKPQSLAEIVDQIACRAINLLDLPDIAAPAQKWHGDR